MRPPLPILGRVLAARFDHAQWPGRCLAFDEPEPGRLRVWGWLEPGQQTCDLIVSERATAVVVELLVCGGGAPGGPSRPLDVFLAGALGSRRVIDGISGSPLPSRAMSRPSLRALVRTTQEAREIRRLRDQTAGVWRPIMRAIHTRYEDEEVLERVRPLVCADPQTSAAVRTRVRELQDGGYIADRALRIVTAAAEGTAPAPIAPEHAELFERERRLGWIALKDAYAELAELEPRLADLIGRLEEMQKGGWLRELETIVGPGSTQTDPLLRSTLAVQIATSWYSIKARRLSRRDPDRAIWDWSPSDPPAPE